MEIKLNHGKVLAFLENHSCVPNIEVADQRDAMHTLCNDDIEERMRELADALVEAMRLGKELGVTSCRCPVCFGSRAISTGFFMGYKFAQIEKLEEQVNAEH